MRKIIILAALLVSSQVFGAFNIVNPIPRALGMGNAFVAVADDVNAIYYNPAGLANLLTWEATFSYSKLYMGISNLDESFIAAGIPLGGLGSAGIGWYKFSNPQYNENVLYFAYAYPFAGTKTSLGFNVKYLVKGFVSNEWTITNPFFFNASGAEVLSSNAVSYGVSILSGYLLNNLTVGLFIDDINTPNVALQGEEILPTTTRGGLAYTLDKNTVISTELLYRGGEYKLHLGAEMVGFRAGDAGILSFRAGGGYGTSNYMNVTAGIGFKFNIPGIDVGGELNYGFLLPLGFAEGNSGTHKVAFTIREAYRELKENKSGEQAVADLKSNIENTDNKATVEKTTSDKPFVAKTIDFSSPVKGANEKAAYNAVVSAAVRSAFIKSEKFDILEPAKAEELLKLKKLRLPGCTTKECAIEAGKILKVEQVLIGSVKNPDKDIELTLKLVEVETGKQVLVERKYENQEALVLGLEKIAGQIANMKKFQERKASIVILELEDLSKPVAAPEVK